VKLNDIFKHFSLLRYGNNYCRKKFHSTGPRPNLGGSGRHFEVNLIPFLWDKILWNRGLF
jgi:hypothetical protein